MICYEIEFWFDLDFGFRFEFGGSFSMFMRLLSIFKYMCDWYVYLNKYIMCLEQGCEIL